MANRTVQAEALREGSVIFVNGKLAFSRLAQLISGQALIESIARQRTQAHRQYPTTQPHTTVTIIDAQLLPQDPNVLTPEEVFVQESLYLSKSGENAGHISYSIDNIGTALPPVLERNSDGSYTQVVLEKDLATGLDVTLVLNVFKSRNYENRGIGIGQVLVNEKIRYHAGSVDTNALAARGIIVIGPVQAIKANPAAAAAVPSAVAANGLPMNTIIENGLPLPGPAAQPAAPAAPAVPAAPSPVAQPAMPVVPAVVSETPEQRIARLEQELAAQRAAAANSGGNSPFDAVGAAPTAGSESPWDSSQGIRYEG
ncbi:MAG: hypothetical protein B5766_05375 [Candidatus Lumbricidophila eiseniae]|uniref:Uncharacterized protein n=1 Tax=Candidatus Lumbricidiphila eiseniae TaxID=1969409 RepID=A0A2A6FS36_9MICO|nr:MAG: hypothetical protein B5766_05375 [Candidatus Lumbricidophila eiseniae]